MLQKYKLELSCFVLVFILLSIVQIYVSKPILIFERFVEGGGWFQIVLTSLYAFFIASKMKNTSQISVWRVRIWLIFSIVFFSQLMLGLLGVDEFLMTGKLHLPIPAVIIAGSIYRMEITFMIILFISTILLSGPAWCSQLCYFGAFDALASGSKVSKYSLKSKWNYKIFGLILTIFLSIVLRYFKVDFYIVVSIALIFGFGGVWTILVVSRKKKIMTHCIGYCPIGTIVSFSKYISPFRMYIDSECTQCLKCTAYCKYDALSLNDIKRLKPGYTCTYCGDCINVCHSNSIRYKFFNFSAITSRNIYLCITISLHSVFLVLARI